MTATDPDDRAARQTARLGTIMVVLIMAGLLLVLGRVAQLKLNPPVPIAALVGSQDSRLPLRARRGTLFDRNGRILAASYLAQQLFVDPQLIAEPNTFSENLGYALGYDPAWIERQVSRRAHRRWVLIDPKLSPQRAEVLRQLELPAAGSQSWVCRQYPTGQRAAQVLGFVGRDGIGLEGLEWSLNGELAGSDGSLRFLRDVWHRPLWVWPQTHARPTHGRSIRLTLDLTVQAIAEQVLGRTCRKFAAESGQIIVLDAHSGQILAMANFPFFDPNHQPRRDPQIRRNRCVTDVFEPGSIFKPFIWAGATDAGVAGPTDLVDCTDSGYYVTDEGRRLRDTHGHGRITWAKVLIHSSNIGMAVTSQRAGSRRIHNAVVRFGFGRLTHCGMPGESPGIVHPLKRWNHYSLTSVPMGQEIAATPIQLVRAFTAFANDGLLVKPHIVLTDQASNLKPIQQRAISAEVARLTRRVLRRAVTEGTGARAVSNLYAIFGKTGTAQIANPQGRGYLPRQFVASFLCAAPEDRPRIVVGCFIHRPDPARGYYGGTVAAPAARDVVEQTLSYLDVPPIDRGGVSTGQLVRQ